jgi:hypothetical protein
LVLLLLGYFDKIGEEVEAHVVAGALLQILKEMEISLMHDVYEDFLGIEITEDLMYSKALVVKQLNKLDVQHCELVSASSY